MKGAATSALTVIFAVMIFTTTAGAGADMRQSGEPLQPTVNNLTAYLDTAEQEVLTNLTGASAPAKPVVRSMFDIGMVGLLGMKIGYHFPTIGRMFQLGGIVFIILYARYMHRRSKRQAAAY